MQGLDNGFISCEKKLPSYHSFAAKSVFPSPVVGVFLVLFYFIFLPPIIHLFSLFLVSSG